MDSSYDLTDEQRKFHNIPAPFEEETTGDDDHPDDFERDLRDEDLQTFSPEELAELGFGGGQ